MNWDVAWGTFLGACAVGFGVLEWLGLRDRGTGKPNGTLSSTLRRWLGVDPAHWRRWVLGSLFVVGLAVFAVHITTSWI